MNDEIKCPICLDTGKIAIRYSNPKTDEEFGLYMICDYEKCMFCSTSN